MTDKIILYDYYRSSCCYRIRIALEYKGLPHELKNIDLVHQGGEQHKDEYRKFNPTKLVPTLIHGNFAINQSMAILDYLDEVFPEKPLLPSDPKMRAMHRAFALNIACEIHPLNNLRVLKYIKDVFKKGDADKMEWYHHWLDVTFSAMEIMVKNTAGKYCFADTFSLADLVLVPQMYNANRFNLPMGAYPTLLEINKRCLELDFVQRASPEQHFQAKQD